MSTLVNILATCSSDNVMVTFLHWYVGSRWTWPPQIGWGGNNTAWFLRLGHKRWYGFHLAHSPWDLCLWSLEPPSENPSALKPPWWRHHRQTERFPCRPTLPGPSAWVFPAQVLGIHKSSVLAPDLQIATYETKLEQKQADSKSCSDCRSVNKISVVFKPLNFGVICYIAIVAAAGHNRSPSG